MKERYIEPGDSIGNGYYYFPKGTQVKEQYKKIIEEFVGETSVREVKPATIRAIVPKEVNGVDVTKEEIERLEADGLIERVKDDGERIQFTDKLYKILK